MQSGYHKKNVNDEKLKQKQIEQEESEREKEAERQLNAKIIEKYRIKRAKQQDVKLHQREKQKRQETVKMQLEREERLKQSKIAASKWRKTRGKKWIADEKRKQKTAQHDEILSTQITQDKTELAKEAYDNWYKNKRQDQKRLAILRKFKQSLLDEDDYVDSPWK